MSRFGYLYNLGCGARFDWRLSARGCRVPLAYPSCLSHPAMLFRHGSVYCTVLVYSVRHAQHSWFWIAIYCPTLDLVEQMQIVREEWNPRYHALPCHHVHEPGATVRFWNLRSTICVSHCLAHVYLVYILRCKTSAILSQVNWQSCRPKLSTQLI